MSDQASPSAIATASPADLCCRWCELTQMARHAEEHRDRIKARDLYEAALALARKLIADEAYQGCKVPLPAMLTISHHNLSDLDRYEGKRTDARAHLERAFNTLAETALRNTAPLELRQACARHLWFALAEILENLPLTPAGRAIGDELTSCVKKIAKKLFNPLAHEGYRSGSLH